MLKRCIFQTLKYFNFKLPTFIDNTKETIMRLVQTQCFLIKDDQKVKIIRQQEIKNSILFTDAYLMTFTFVQQKECTNRLLYRIEVHQ